MAGPTDRDRLEALDRNLKRRRAEIKAEADSLDALSDDIAGRIERLENGNVVPIRRDK